MSLFLKAYEISTLYHDTRQILGRYPHRLGNDLQYDINWELYYLREKMHCPVIWIRAINDKRFSKVVLSVAAENDKIRYQDTLVLTKISDVPTQAALPSIPFRNLKLTQRSIHTKYDHIRTEIIELYDAECMPVRLGSDCVSFLHPIDQLEVDLGLKEGYVEKWGKVFNAQYIEQEIDEEMIRLIGPMFSSPRIFYRLRRAVFSKRWIVKMSFWRKNLIHARQLSREFAKYWREQQDSQYWQEQRRPAQRSRD